MAIRRDEIQLTVEINGKKAGGSLGQLAKDAINLKRELKNATDPKDVQRIEADLKKVNDVLAQSRARTRGVAKGLSNMRSEGSKLPGVFSKVSSALNKAGILALIALVVNGIRKVISFSRESLNFFDVQAKADAQLKASLISTNQAAGKSFEDLKNQAKELQGTTLFGDETVQGAQSILLTFTNIKDEVFDGAVPAVLDMATVLKTDLKSASIQVGKALNDPIKGVTALGRAGVQFTDDQKETIKTLVETNRVADAQKIILKELETQFGGSAEAAAKAGTGGLTQLKNQFNDIREKVGELINRGLKFLTPTFNRILGVVNKVVDGVFKIPAAFKAVGAGFNQFIANVKNNFEIAKKELDLFSKQAKLTFTINGNSREALKKEIAEIKASIATASSSGRSVGEAAAAAYNEAIKQVDDFSDLAQSSSQSSVTTTNNKIDTKTTEQLFKIDLAAVKTDIDKKNVLLEADRLQNKINEEDYAKELENLNRERIEKQIQVYKDYSKEQSIEALKLNNELLRLDSESLEDRKKIEESKYTLDVELLRNKLVTEQITQKEFDQQREQLRKVHLENMLGLLKDSGPASAIEVQKIKNELDQIASSPITFQVEIEEGPTSSSPEDIAKTLDDLFNSEFGYEEDVLQTKLRRSLISELQYQDEVLQLRESFLKNRFDQLKASGEAETEVAQEVFTQIIELEKKQHELRCALKQAADEEDKKKDEERKISFEEGLNNTASLLSIVDQAYASSISEREKLIESLKNSENSQTEAVKNRIAEEQKALRKEKNRKKGFEIAAVQINLASEISNIFKGFSGIPFIGQLLAVAQAAAATIRAKNQIRRIKAAATGSKVSANNKSKLLSSVDPLSLPTFQRSVTSIPPVSGQLINVPENIEGVETGDNVLVLAKQNEVILNQLQQQRLAKLFGAGPKDLFKIIGVPGFTDGGVVPNTTPSRSVFFDNRQDNSSQLIIERLDMINNSFNQRQKAIKSYVVFEDLEEAEEEITRIRNSANLN